VGGIESSRGEECLSVGGVGCANGVVGPTGMEW